MAKRSHFKVDTKMLEQLRRQTPEHIHQLLVGVAYEMLADIKLSFGTSPAGITYPRGNGKLYTASQPGYPPNIDTGTLTGSMAVFEESQGRVLIHDGVEYGIHLEIGTSKMAARPFVAPVFEAWRRGAFARFVQKQGIIPWQ